MSALVHSLPLEGCQAQPDGVVVKVLNNVTPIDLLAQSAVLFFNIPMLAFPYGGFRKFSSAERLRWCKRLRLGDGSTFSTAPRYLSQWVF